MKIKEIAESSVTFDNGTELSFNHEQDCCEHVYADFETLKSYNVLPHTGEKISIYDIEFPADVPIEGIQELGFNLIAADGSKWLVPCYNSQNGYYSSGLELIITEGDRKTTINISDFVKDEIN